MLSNEADRGWRAELYVSFIVIHSRNSIQTDYGHSRRSFKMEHAGMAHRTEIRQQRFDRQLVGGEEHGRLSSFLHFSSVYLSIWLSFGDRGSP